MTAAAAAGWAGTGVVVVGYVLSVRRETPLLLHRANAIGAFGTGWSAVEARAWPNLFITAMFGAVGWWGWVAASRLDRRRDSRVPGRSARSL